MFVLLERKLLERHFSWSKGFEGFKRVNRGQFIDHDDRTVSRLWLRVVQGSAAQSHPPAVYIEKYPVLAWMIMNGSISWAVGKIGKVLYNSAHRLKVHVSSKLTSNATSTHQTGGTKRGDGQRRKREKFFIWPHICLLLHSLICSEERKWAGHRSGSLAALQWIFIYTRLTQTSFCRTYYLECACVRLLPPRPVLCTVL